MNPDMWNNFDTSTGWWAVLAAVVLVVSLLWFVLLITDVVMPRLKFLGSVRLIGVVVGVAAACLINLNVGAAAEVRAHNVEALRVWAGNLYDAELSVAQCELLLDRGSDVPVAAGSEEGAVVSAPVSYVMPARVSGAVDPLGVYGSLVEVKLFNREDPVEPVTLVHKAEGWKLVEGLGSEGEAELALNSFYVDRLDDSFK